MKVRPRDAATADETVAARVLAEIVRETRASISDEQWPGFPLNH
jgi:hypothetical protein